MFEFKSRAQLLGELFGMILAYVVVGILGIIVSLEVIIWWLRFRGIL
jgi:hypothetical protein